MANESDDRRRPACRRAPRQRFIGRKSPACTAKQTDNCLEKQAIHNPVHASAHAHRQKAKPKLADLVRIDAGLGIEVEAVDFACVREVRDLHRHLDPALVLARDLPFAQERQRFAQRQVLARLLVEQTVELVADGGEREPGRSADDGAQPIVLGRSIAATASGSSIASLRATAAETVSSPVLICPFLLSKGPVFSGDRGPELHVAWQHCPINALPHPQARQSHTSV